MSRKRCTWTWNTDGYWSTDCGHAYFIAAGQPSENEMRYCTYCGKRIEEKGYKEEGNE